MNLRDAKKITEVLDSEGIGYGVVNYLDDIEDEDFNYWASRFREAHDKIEKICEDARIEHGDALYEA